MLDLIQLRTRLVGPFSLSLASGECLAILGPSGSGKSLFLRAIADLDPNDGDVRLNGRSREDIPAPEWRRLVGLVPAESGWWCDRVTDHFEAEPDISGVLAELGLPDALDWPVARLSSGERQRLAIIRALQLSPKVLLLDEPTAALDTESTHRVETVLQRHIESGMTMIFVTHDPEQAARLTKRRILLNGGQIVTGAGRSV